MKTLFLLSTFTVIVLALSSDASMSSAKDSVTPTGTATVQSTSRFSSRYISLTGRGCGSGMTRREERETEERGTDLPTRCKGFGGYDILVGYSACSAHISAEKGADSYPLVTQAGNFKQNTVEWRMAQANGKTVPFAVIMRVYEYAGDDLCATGGKVTAEFLVVKGLDGFEHIDEKIDVKTTPNPNLKARQLADKKYGMRL
ncbi:MAG: hypothetical protein H7Z16_17360 [Pyrinomonadaceae bacterium]|nr:hypothetical protein [Pyrinomonadaceae bacterium]